MMTASTLARKSTSLTLTKNLQGEAGKKFLFITMSAERNFEIEAEVFDGGARDFILTPFRSAILLRRVANVFRAVR